MSLFAVGIRKFVLRGSMNGGEHSWISDMAGTLLVGFCCEGFQVIGVAASSMRAVIRHLTLFGVVACVVNFKSVWNFSFMHHVRDTVGILHLTRGYHPSISIGSPISSPEPASSLRIDKDVLEESFFDGRTINTAHCDPPRSQCVRLWMSALTLSRAVCILPRKWGLNGC
jgi:hypothetical protein